MISSQSSAIRIRAEHHVLVRIRHEFLCFAFLVSSRKKKLHSSKIHSKCVTHKLKYHCNDAFVSLHFYDAEPLKIHRKRMNAQETF